jgi:hypothetical protein
MPFLLLGVRIASSGMVISTGATGNVYECKRMISAPTEKGKTMTDREKLIGLLDNFGIDDDWYTNTEIADDLLANGVTFASAVPGPSDADPNIMELCFHNGERHMKEKMLAKLAQLLEGMDYHKAVFICKCLEDL